jgi:hypothetical protein
MIRGMFEIAAKQYAAANGIDTQIQTAGGAKDKRLISLLDECRKDLTKNHKPHDPYSRELHGSMVELGDPKSMLSIDSLAQLIHNPKFSVKVDNICISFSNVFPLLKELTK